MMSKEIAEILISRGRKECISNVRIVSDSDVLSQLENRIDPEQPYHLGVTLLKVLKQLRIQMLVYPLLKVPCSSIFPKLVQLNLALGCGCVCSQPPDGILHFKMEHLCEDSKKGPSAEFFERLLVECVKGIRGIEHILLFETMVATGLPKETAERFVNHKFGESLITDWNQLMETGKPGYKLRKLMSTEQIDTD